MWLSNCVEKCVVGVNVLFSIMAGGGGGQKWIGGGGGGQKKAKFVKIAYPPLPRW